MCLNAKSQKKIQTKTKDELLLHFVNSEPAFSNFTFMLNVKRGMSIA